MKNIIPCLILSLAILGCDSAFRIGKGKSNSGLRQGNRVVGEVCYSDDSFCLPQLAAQGLEDPKGDYEYLDNDRGPQYRKPSFFVDLRSQNLNQKISDNFNAIDYISAAKGPYAILSRTLVNAMQGLRNELQKPITINSGYRSPGYNKTIGGSANFSRHTYGDAVDFKANGASFEELQDLCEKYGASFTLVYTNHIHCDWRQRPLDAGFYPPALDPSDRHRHLPYHEITQGHIAYELHNGRIILSVENFFTEEPGEFVYEWSVITPTGEQIQSTRPSIVLNPQAGTYNISVRVGNSVQLNEILEW